MNQLNTQINCADNVTKLPSQTVAKPNSTPAAFAAAISPDTRGVPAPASAATPAPAPLVTPPTPIDPFTKIRLESLKRKQRADAFSNSLTDDQILQIAGWMEKIDNLSEVHRCVIAPPPDGLGLKVNLSTLRRLRCAWRAEALSDLSDSMFDVITDMEDGQTDFNQSDRIQSAISHLLHRKAFDLAQTHPGSDVLRDVLTSIQKLSALEYKRQKIALEHAKQNRRQQSAPSTNTTRHHRVDLNIISTPASQHAQPQPSLPPTALPDTRQAVEIIAPLPEVIL